MNTEEILKLAAIVERRVAAIYRKLYGRFKDNELCGYLWHTLAVEEEGHAEFLDAELKMLKTVPDAFGATRIDEAPLKDSIELLDRIEERIDAEELDIKEAIRLAMEIERDMVERKYADIVEVAAPALKKVFKELTKGSDHVERLTIAAKKLGVEV